MLRYTATARSANELANMLARMKNRRRKFAKTQSTAENIAASLLGKAAVDLDATKEQIKPLTTTAFDGRPIDIVPVKLDLLPN